MTYHTQSSNNQHKEERILVKHGNVQTQPGPFETLAEAKGTLTAKWMSRKTGLRLTLRAAGTTLQVFIHFISSNTTALTAFCWAPAEVGK